MTKMFLDFGSHYGEGLSYFVDYYNINSEWLVETYEITPKSAQITAFCVQNLPVFSKAKAVIKVIAQGVSDSNRRDILYVHEVCDTGEGNNIIQSESKDIDIDGSVMRQSHEVEVVDINDVINRGVSNGATEFYIKMDIEGSEFKALERLFESEHLQKIKEIHIEWHERFFPDKEYKIIKKQNIIEHLRSKNIKTHDMIGCLIDSDLYYKEFEYYVRKAINKV